MLHDDRDAATLRYRPANLVQYARHGPCSVCVTCVSAVGCRHALCGLNISSYEHFIQQFICHRVCVWDRLNLFLEDDSVAERVSRRLLGTAETEGRPAKLTRFFRH